MQIIGYLCIANNDAGDPTPIVINPERDLMVIPKETIPANLLDVVGEIEKDGETAVLGLIADPTGRGAA